MILSQQRCPKCISGLLSLKRDSHSTFFLCNSCGLAVQPSCPHCEEPSVALDYVGSRPRVYCRTCDCADAQLAMPVCERARLPIPVAV